MCGWQKIKRYLVVWSGDYPPFVAFSLLRLAGLTLHSVGVTDDVIGKKELALKKNKQTGM